MDHVQICRALCGVYYTRYSADRASVGRPLGRAQSMGKRVPADIRYDGVADSMRVFGVTLDRRLTFDNHASAVARPCNYHARAIRNIRHLLTLNLAQTLACSLILSRIDHCNSMLHGAPYRSSSESRTTYMERIVLQAPRRSYVNSQLQTLHWLPVEQRTNYKLAVLTFKNQQTSSPQYLNQHISLRTSARNTRSSSVPLLCVPF